MPPNNDPRVSSCWDSYPTPGDVQPTQFWVDSSLEDKRVAPQANDKDNYAAHPLNRPPKNGTKIPALPLREQPARPQVGKKPELRFFNVTDPKELKDRSQMRLNRQHVMHTFLETERQKPLGQRDVRVDGAGATIKRKRSRIQMPTVPFTAGRKMNGSPAERGSLPTPSESSCASDRETDQRGAPCEQRSSEQKKARPTAQTNDQDRQLVRGINRTWESSRYIETNWEDIAFHTSTSDTNNDPETTVGAALNPFNTWPAFSSTDIDVNRLKWSCSQRFGSEGITIHWVPELLRARHAFLSTICISSAHDDIMARASQPNPADWLSTREGVERLRVRTEVIGLVNQSLGDPELRVADATIISVLHLLNSEVMGCDDRVMKTHQDGLHRMVRQRGGLAGLGVQGQLARILTITMYMISVLRESPPHGEFVAYATKHPHPTQTNGGGRTPESPIYCRPSGFRTITQQNCPSIETWDLLNNLRELTTHFFLLRRPRQHDSRNVQDHRTALNSIHDKISALPPSDDLTLTFPDLHSRYVYECLRLAALLYAHALATHAPFSLASIGVSTRLTTTAERSTTPPEPLHLALRRALLKTDTSSLWGPLAGVLFFIALIGGAGANPGPLAQEEREGVQEDGRKFLAAVAVRCSIVLSFEHGGVVLETLKRVLAVERILNRGGWEVEGEGCCGGDGGGGGCGMGAVPETWTQGLWTSEPGVEKSLVDGVEMAGPDLPPMQQQLDWTQMADFAREFEGLQ